MTDAKMVAWQGQTMSLILIVSVYTDFFPLEFGKIQISSSKFCEVQIFFSGMRKGFLYIFFTHAYFSSTILMLFVIYPGFVLDQRGRSATTFKTKGLC